MEDIYLDKILSNNEILTTLSEVFSELTVSYYDFNDDVPEELDFDNPNHIFFNVGEGFCGKEFNCKISVCGTPNGYQNEREFYLGKLFSDKYKIRTLVAFEKPNEPYVPYYDIVFDDGKIFLADDSEVDLEENSGSIKILQEYDIPIFEFDNKAEIIKN
jgi:hypothetical protein